MNPCSSTIIKSLKVPYEFGCFHLTNQSIDMHYIDIYSSFTIRVFVLHMYKGKHWCYSFVNLNSFMDKEVTGSMTFLVGIYMV